MNESTQRHLYVSVAVILFLIAIEITVYFTITTGVERRLATNIMKGVGSALEPVGSSLPSPLKRQVCSHLAHSSDQPAPGNAAIRNVAFAVAIAAFLGACGLVKFMLSSTLAPAQKKWALAEICCVALGFLVFDLFFFLCIVRGNEPVTASGMLEGAAEGVIKDLSLSELRRAARCTGSPYPAPTHASLGRP